MAPCLAVERVNPLRGPSRWQGGGAVMTRTPADEHRLELADGRTIGYATWGDPDGSPGFIGHGTPGSRLALSPGLDDPEWIRRQRLRFIGVDRPSYGYSDPWTEASLLDCASDLVRVADDLGIERFWALGVSGGAPYVLALGALVPERRGGVAAAGGRGWLARPGAREGLPEGAVEESEMPGEAQEGLA